MGRFGRRSVGPHGAFGWGAFGWTTALFLSLSHMQHTPARKQRVHATSHEAPPRPHPTKSGKSPPPLGSRVDTRRCALQIKSNPTKHPSPPLLLPRRSQCEAATPAVPHPPPALPTCPPRAPRTPARHATVGGPHGPPAAAIAPNAPQRPRSLPPSIPPWGSPPPRGCPDTLALRCRPSRDAAASLAARRVQLADARRTLQHPQGLLEQPPPLGGRGACMRTFCGVAGRGPRRGGFV
jgi:hypothetical protein